LGIEFEQKRRVIMGARLVLQSNVIIISLLMITGHVKPKEFQVGKCLFILKSCG
jgi:hypothetical protein